MKRINEQQSPEEQNSFLALVSQLRLMVIWLISDLTSKGNTVIVKIQKYTFRVSDMHKWNNLRRCTHLTLVSCNFYIDFRGLVHLVRLGKVPFKKGIPFLFLFSFIYKLFGGRLVFDVTTLWRLSTNYLSTAIKYKQTEAGNL